MNDPVEAQPGQPGTRRPARRDTHRLRTLFARLATALLEPTPAPAAGGTAPPGCVYAVRRDWADGVHDFIGPAGTTVYAAAALWDSEHTRWRHAPWRPHLSVVLISRHDFWLHAHDRPDCHATDCPTATEDRL